MKLFGNHFVSALIFLNVCDIRMQDFCLRDGVVHGKGDRVQDSSAEQVSKAEGRSG